MAVLSRKKPPHSPSHYHSHDSAIRPRESSIPVPSGNQQITMGNIFSTRKQQTRTTIARVDTVQPPTQPRKIPSPERPAVAPSITQPAATSTPPPIHETPIPPPVIPIEEAFSPLSVDDIQTATPIYTLSVTDDRVCLFVPSRFEFIEADRSQLDTIEEGEIYLVSFSPDGLGFISSLNEERRKAYINRRAFECLLLGSRVRDFEQRCALVVQMGELLLNMPAQRRNVKKLKLKTVLGEEFEVRVKYVQRNDEDRRWIVACFDPTESMPSSVKKGSMLEIVGVCTPQPRVTDALMTFTNERVPIFNWPLLSCIYGKPSHRISQQVPIADPSIRLKNAGVMILNPQQAEAVARYNSSSVPAFVIEAPPGSGKTMTAAAMAVSYEGKGVQLFLSTANVPVFNIALQLAKLDYGSLKAIHFVSSECEDRMTEETRSPFSVLSLAKASERLRETIERLEGEKERAPNDEDRKKVQEEINKACGPFFDQHYHVYFATIDMILGRLFKPNARGRHQVDFVKKQLQTKVERVVIDEASQLTEAALNAIILCFPNAQIVLIGDSKQLAPFKYTEGDIVSELSARSALEVMKNKKNLPVIKLNRVYRASSSVIAHYNHVFYGGRLVSEEQEPKKKPLGSLGRRAKGSSCLFWQVKGFTQQRGTSKINFAEINALKFIVNQLRQSRIDEKDVMIISYYEAQRKEAEEELPKGYEVLTVDSAQGREKRIVIVLTTRTAPPTDKNSFFTDPMRCNVAMSRHKEALIVLGHPSLAAAENWAEVLSPKYFKHVDNDNRAW